MYRKEGCNVTQRMDTDTQHKKISGKMFEDYDRKELRESKMPSETRASKPETLQLGMNIASTLNLQHL